MSADNPIQDPTDLVLSDGSLRLEPMTLRHAGALFEAVEVSRETLVRWLTSMMAPGTAEETAAFVSERMERWRAGLEFYFVLMDGADCVGIAFLNTFHPRHQFANLGYWVRTDRAGRGYATRAVRLLARFGFEQFGLCRIEIVTDVENVASQRVAEKAGALREGVLRNRLVGEQGPCDGVMFSLVPEDLSDFGF